MYVDPKIIKTAVDVGVTLYKQRKDFLSVVRKLRRLVKLGLIDIAVFGPGGTGKSTLGTLLSQHRGEVVRPTPYTMSLITERYPLQEKFACELIVAPGQERYRDSTWPTIYDQIRHGRRVVVVNVVSYGIHSFEDLSYTEVTKYYKPGMTVEDFLAVYLEERRAVELEIIRELKPRLIDMPGRVSMITLVTKQDLWWQNRLNVIDHYTTIDDTKGSGEYHKEIKAIEGKRGTQRFVHNYVSASLVINNFKTDQNELLIPTSEGYDSNIQLANLKAMLDALYAFSEG